MDLVVEKLMNSFATNEKRFHDVFTFFLGIGFK